jgi:dipeptidyl aminopeptidase/acylaminoacyl peptidase
MIAPMIEPDSLHTLQFGSDPTISSDGQLIAFVVTRIEEDSSDPDKPKKVYRSSIHLSRDGGVARPFTTGKNRDSSPRFSPDGTHLAFVRLIDGKAQIFTVPLNGGEPRQRTQLKSGVFHALPGTEPRFSPDGTRLAFVSRGDWQDTRAEDGTPRVFERIDYKLNGIPGPGFKPDVPAQLHVLDLETDAVQTVTNSKTGVSGFDWLPDGSGLVFAAAINLKQDSRIGKELWLVRVALRTPKRARTGKTGSGKSAPGVVRLTDWNGTIDALSVSPDGKHVAFTGSDTAYTQPSDAHLHVVRLEEGRLVRPERLDTTLDRYAGNAVNSDSRIGSYPVGPAWVSSVEILQGYVLGGSTAILAHDLRGRSSVVLHDVDANIPSFDVNLHGRLVFLRETHASVLELHMQEHGGQIKQLSSLTADSGLLKTVQHGLERIVLARDGFTVEGWLMKPHGWKRNKKYPIILQIHGGPATAYGHGYMHEFQMLASRGFAVAFCNIRGSIGYGLAQTQGTNGAYGTGDFDDLMAFLDACLEQFPWLDRKRQAVIGGSYGGVMTNWIISHTDRFRVAVTDRSICNWLSFYGTSDIGYWFPVKELRGHVPEDLEHLWECSPLKHVRNVKTPCLIIHSEEDHRCPIEQGEQWYTALKRLNIPTRFVRFPSESHELSRSGRPDRREFRLREIAAWFERWLA